MATLKKPQETVRLALTGLGSSNNLKNIAAATSRVLGQTYPVRGDFGDRVRMAAILGRNADSRVVAALNGAMRDVYDVTPADVLTSNPTCTPGSSN